MNDEIQYIHFSVGEQVCALPIHQVHEVIKMVPITSSPFNTGAVKGFATLYGKVVSVVSLRALLGIPEDETTSSNRIIVVPYQGANVPLIVDSVDSIVSYKEIVEPSEKYNRYMKGAFKGIAHAEDHEAGILDLDVILGDLPNA
ncbi:MULTISPECIES: chemotaxis protein CheW [Paenibacillus]|uniref:chemotaxis protein CheW n=1 Tax=Paenibacillus TaxID=44249 RepID=UPI001F28B915|nr:chemotaxis protein CheW [Paenibacillus sp. JJ-223]CAH1212719.1 Chemotaxis protein CheV [Paenibacillus sp. JJ-223]